MNEPTHPILCRRSSTELSRATLSPRRRRDRRCMERDFDFVVVLTFYFFMSLLLQCAPIFTISHRAGRFGDET